MILTALLVVGILIGVYLDRKYSDLLGLFIIGTFGFLAILNVFCIIVSFSDFHEMKQKSELLQAVILEDAELDASFLQTCYTYNHKLESIKKLNSHMIFGLYADDRIEDLQPVVIKD